MRILTENETAILIGDLSKIILPDNVDLYLSYGIPQLFQRVSDQTSQLDDKDWLFVPLEIIESLKQNNNNIPKTPIVSLNNDTPLSCDKKFIFPVLSGQEIEILLVSDSQKVENINTSLLKSIIRTFAAYKESIIEKGNCTDRFIKAVIKHNDTHLSFAKSILNLIVKEIDRSCAGYYSSEEKSIKRRFIVGDIHKFEQLPPVIPFELKSVLENSLFKNNNFLVPLNFSNELQFLSTPPDINYIHKGLKSKYCENIISVQLPGSASLSTIHLLKFIVRQASNLSEAEFMKTNTTLELYKQLTFKQHSSLSELQITEKLFALLNSHLRVSSLIYLSEIESFEIGYTSTNEYKVYENCSIKLSSECLSILQNFDHVIVQNTENKTFSSDSILQINTEIRSHKIYKFSITKGHWSYLILGSPKESAIFEVYSMFLDEIIDAFKILIASVKMRTNLKDAYFKEKILHARLKLINILSNGYFNQIFSKLTVLIAKTEYLKKHISLLEDTKESSLMAKPIASIAHNTDLIENYITALRTLMPNREEYYERKLNSSEIMKKIPTLLQGYLHHTYIKNNISIRLDNVTHSKSEFFIAGYVIDDVVIPVILSIIDDAILDGTISLYAGNELETVYVKIAFHKDLIASCDIGAMILQIFHEHDIETTDLDMFTFSNCTISNNINSNGMVTIHIKIKQENYILQSNFENQKEEPERV